MVLFQPPVPGQVVQGIGGDTSHNTPYAIDFQAGADTDVRSVAVGTVVGIRTGSFRGDLDAGRYGNYVTILHDGGFYATYAHLSAHSSYLQVGAHVSAGDVIGKSGNTGDTRGTTGYHFHLQMGLRWTGEEFPTSNTGDVIRASPAGRSSDPNDPSIETDLRCPAVFFEFFASPEEHGDYIVWQSTPTGGPTRDTDIFGVADSDPASSDHDDLEGDSAHNRVFAGAGNDRLTGWGGNDTLVGGTGNDTLWGAERPTDAGRRSTLNTDTIVAASFDNDVLNGNMGIDTLYGGGGLDTLFGGADSDVLFGGAGNDVLDGGTGNDVAVYAGALADYTIRKSGGVVTVERAAAGIGDAEGRDTLTGIEMLRFTSGEEKSVGSIPESGKPTLIDAVVRVGNSIRFFFDEIVRAISGAVEIVQQNGQVAQSVSVSDPGRTKVSGGTVEIQPLPLLADEQYYVTFSPGVFQTSSGGVIGGVSEPTLRFSTVSTPANTPPPIDPPVFTEGRDVAHIPDGGGPYDALGGDDVLIGSPGVDRVVLGGSGRDVFYAGGKGSALAGGPDDDWFIANVAGSDRFYGDHWTSPLGGNDTADFSNFTTSINADLNNTKVVANGFEYWVQTANVIGGNGSDTLQGTDLDNRLVGGASADTITSLGGNDALEGGSGNDQLSGGAGNDRLYGDDGDDSLHGEGGDDFADGGAGNDFLYGGHGNDQLAGREGADGLFGEEGDDTLIASAGNDRLRGLDGIDTVDFSQAPVGITGGGGGVTVSGWGFATIEEAEVFIASPHNDDFGLGPQYQRAHLGAGNDILTANGVALVYAEDGNDWLLSFTGGQAYGGFGNDTLLAFAGSSDFYGDDGNDTLTGGSTSRMCGGAGNDVLYGSNGSATSFGESGNDHIYGSSATDDLYGGSGNDRINAGDGDDQAVGGDDDDSIDGAGGNDFIYGGHGSDTLTGGDGDDGVFGEDGNDTLIASGGADRLRGLDGIDTVSFEHAPAGLTGGSGQITVASWGTSTLEELEVFVGSSHRDDVQLNAPFQEARLGGGNDVVLAIGLATVSLEDGNDQAFALDLGRLYGGSGNDDLRALAGDAEFYGDDGNDTLFGGIGNDTLSGGLGNDALHGGDGVDMASYADATSPVIVNLGTGRAIGGAGADRLTSIEVVVASGFDDTLAGGNAAEVLYGGAGNDALYGRGGADTLYGGAGDDLYRIEQTDDVADETGASGFDRAQVLVSGATIGQDIERIDMLVAGGGTVTAGGTTNNTLNGSSGADWLVAGDGDDVLSAGAGNDVLFGGEGNDSLLGAAGADTYFGGGGNDYFRIDQADDVASEVGGSGYDYAKVYVSGATVGEGIERIDMVVAGTVTTAGTTASTLNGSSGADRLIAGAGNDRLNSAGGNDTLEGGDGHDQLLGGDGLDRLLGGAGNDRMSGGAGADVFAYTAGDGRDRILDFSAAQGDKVDLTGVSFASLGAAGNIALLSDGATITAQAGYVWTAADFI